MNIRAVKTKDLDGFYSLFCEVSAEGLFSARRTPPPVDAVARALIQVEINNWPVYVLERSGLIVGSAEAYPESFCRANGRTDVGILGMQVKRELRGCGYGSALLSAVVEHCRKIGFSSIELSVLKSNTVARSLYVKTGFTWLEDLPACLLPSGASDQPIRMRLAL